MGESTAPSVVRAKSAVVAPAAIQIVRSVMTLPMMRAIGYTAAFHRIAYGIELRRKEKEESNV